MQPVASQRSAEWGSCPTLKQDETSTAEPLTTNKTMATQSTFKASWSATQEMDKSGTSEQRHASTNATGVAATSTIFSTTVWSTNKKHVTSGTLTQYSSTTIAATTTTIKVTIAKTTPTKSKIAKTTNKEHIKIATQAIESTIGSTAEPEVIVKRISPNSPPKPKTTTTVTTALRSTQEKGITPENETQGKT